MALTLAKAKGQVRAELGVTKSELPDTLLLDYINQIQSEVSQMIGPALGPGMRKRVELTSTALGFTGTAGAYTNSSGTLTGFATLPVDTTLDDAEIVFWGDTSTVYKDIIDDVVNVTTVALKKNAKVGGNLAAVDAIILYSLTAVDPTSIGFYLPEDCALPLYFSDLSDPESEERIESIQTDDTEQYVTNTYWGAETKAALHVGDVVHILKGSSGTFPKTLAVTYLKRPAQYFADADLMTQAQGRLPEEYWGIMRAGVLKLAAMHLRKVEEAAMAGMDMTDRLNAIRASFNLSRAYHEREEESQ